MLCRIKQKLRLMPNSVEFETLIGWHTFVGQLQIGDKEASWMTIIYLTQILHSPLAERTVRIVCRCGSYNDIRGICRVFWALYLPRPRYIQSKIEKNMAIDFTAFGECMTYYGKQLFMGDIELYQWKSKYVNSNVLLTLCVTTSPYTKQYWIIAKVNVMVV